MTATATPDIREELELEPSELVSYVRSGVINERVMEMTLPLEYDVQELLDEGLTPLQLEDCYLLHRTALENGGNEILKEFVSYLEEMITDYFARRCMDAGAKLGFNRRVTSELLHRLALRDFDAEALMAQGVEASDAALQLMFLGPKLIEFTGEDRLFLIFVYRKLLVLNRELSNKERRHKEANPPRVAMLASQG